MLISMLAFSVQPSFDVTNTLDTNCNSTECHFIVVKISTRLNITNYLRLSRQDITVLGISVDPTLYSEVALLVRMNWKYCPA
jgi:hypothetical protein